MRVYWHPIANDHMLFSFPETIINPSTDRYQFEAVAIETAGIYSDGTNNIVRDIGRNLTEATGDKRETSFG